MLLQGDTLDELNRQVRRSGQLRGLDQAPRAPTLYPPISFDRQLGRELSLDSLQLLAQPGGMFAPAVRHA